MKTVDENISKTLVQDIDALKNSQTIEELVYASWQIRFHRNQYDPTIIRLKAERELEIRYEDCKDDVIQKLATALITPMHEYDCIRRIAESEGLSILDIPEILKLEKSINKSNQPYCFCLDKLEQLVQKQIPSCSEFELQKARNIEIAKITVRAFIKSQCDTKYEFCQKTMCSMEELTSAATILATIGDPMYSEYEDTVTFRGQWVIQDEKGFHEKISDQKDSLITAISQISEEEVNSLLLYGTSDNIRAFCTLYGLNLSLVSTYLRYNTKDKARLLSAGDIFEKQAILAKFQEQNFSLARSVAEEMKQILQQELYQSKADTGIVPLFDLYHFHEQSSLSFDDFKGIINNIGFDSELYKIIDTYKKKHKLVFNRLDDRKIAGLICAQKMTCDGHHITFEKIDAVNAYKDIKQKNMPMYSGVVFQAIERQKSKREAAMREGTSPKVRKKIK